MRFLKIFSNRVHKASAHPQGLSQIERRMGIFRKGESPRGPRGNNLPAAFAAFGAEVDYVVGRFDHVRMMFDHDDRIRPVHQFVKNVQELAYVFEMQAGRGFVEYVERLSLAAA